METKRLYTPNGAAFALGISRSKAYELMKRGALRFVLIDNDRKIPSEEIDRLCKEGTTGPAQ